MNRRSVRVGASSSRGKLCIGKGGDVEGSTPGHKREREREREKKFGRSPEDGDDEVILFMENA
jgi:hypothetical protein